MPWTYCLQILQGHISNVRHLICVLNISRDLESFISSGTKLHIIGPILLMVSKPKCVAFAFGILKFIFFIQCVLSVEEKGRFCASYRLHFVSILHEVMVHSTRLPKCPLDSRVSLECWEGKKYLTSDVIMTSSVNEKRSILTYL